MAQIVLFPSALGVRPGITDTADRLRAAGHEATVVDQYDGRSFDDYDEGMALVQRIGRPALKEAALAGAAQVSGPFHAVGFSLGCVLAQWVAGHRPEDARGLVLVSGALPARYVEAAWPAGVPGQVHQSVEDPWGDGPEVVAELAADVEAAGGSLETFDYPGSGHLFNDPGLSEEYQPESAELFYARLLEFVATTN